MAAAHDIPSQTLTAFTDPAIGTPADNDQPAKMGQFEPPFAEPTIDGQNTDKKCIPKQGASNSPLDDSPYLDCKPAGVSVNVLPGARVMYYDGLEGTENVKTSIVLEYGHNAGNDQARLLDLRGPSWTPTGSPVFPAYQNHALFPPPLSSTEDYNDDALFCSDNKFLPDGRIISTGGSDYYNDPGFQAGNANYGITELEGLRDARIYDPRTNTWSRSGPMHIGRWYPTAITLGNGKLFVASGVEKLVKPVYPDRPADSGSNVTQTETYDPTTGQWTLNPDSARRDLPLYPRLHLLPDGKVFFNAAGQAFNPFGQSYDESQWNDAAVYDPNTQQWRDLGIPGDGDGPPPDFSQDPGNPAGDTAQGFGIPGGGRAFVWPGFRGSTFSVMLPLEPDSHGNYTKASFLTAGGVLNPPSPGSYFATSDARVTTIDTAANDKMETRAVDDLSQPRWYGSGVELPTGQVLAFSGSDRDEVFGPGVERPIKKAELFDPATGKWQTLASGYQPRTYHNTAVLLPDGRVLVGGHAPISTMYGSDITLPGGVTAPNDGRDPSFEIFKPPYLFWGGRPKIAKAPSRLAYGKRFTVTVKGPASNVNSVVLVRNPSVTHLVDADQRNVVLRVVHRKGRNLTVAAPPDGAVAPPGPYMLFVNRKTAKGLVPSVSKQTFVGIGGLERKASHRHRHRRV